MVLTFKQFLQEDQAIDTLQQNINQKRLILSQKAGKLAQDQAKIEREKAEIARQQAVIDKKRQQEERNAALNKAANPADVA